jgi:asparagine synthase (glutamine-hydrolysing)
MDDGSCLAFFEVPGMPFELKTQLDATLLGEGMRRLRPLERIAEVALSPMPKSPVARVAALESVCYLRNQLLRDTDWAGMAHHVEIRTPLVDFELLKLLAPLVPHLKPGLGKTLIARAPSQPLPASIVGRPKTGFGVPTAHWMELASTHGKPATKGNASRAWARLVGQSSVSMPELTATDSSLPA